MQNPLTCGLLTSWTGNFRFTQIPSNPLQSQWWPTPFCKHKSKKSKLSFEKKGTPLPKHSIIIFRMIHFERKYLNIIIPPSGASPSIPTQSFFFFFTPINIGFFPPKSSKSFKARRAGTNLCISIGWRNPQRRQCHLRNVANCSSENEKWEGVAVTSVQTRQGVEAPSISVD